MYQLPNNFIQKKIEVFLEQGHSQQLLAFRFPPEPNGRLHLGHAKAMCLNFILAEHYKAPCYLRFDDTNPDPSYSTYYQSISDDVAWLGFTPHQKTYASNYFNDFYKEACHLIDQGLAFVDLESAEEMKAKRGSLTQPGAPSDFRDSMPLENHALFQKMKDGKFAEGEAVLRAKIDMSAANITLRDPVLYRILKKTHARTNDTWCIYPLYDFAHPLSDCLETISHSLCTLEFEDHRPLYDWLVSHSTHSVKPNQIKPEQIEFARLDLNGAITSKRKIAELIESRIVEGWDDPRIATLGGLRARGHAPEAIIDFCLRTGFGKANSTCEYSYFENISREHLNTVAPRTTAVRKPVPLTLSHNDTTETPKTEILWVEQDDCRSVPDKNFYRFAPQQLVRLRHGPIVRCLDVSENAAGVIESVRAEAIPETIGKNMPDGTKVRGVVHWLSQATAIPATFRHYNNMEKTETNGWIDESAPRKGTVQCERIGYMKFDEAKNIWIETLTLREKKK